MINEKEGTSVRSKLIKSMKYGESVDIMYVDGKGKVTKRRIQVLQVSEGTFGPIVTYGNHAVLFELITCSRLFL